ncbi:Multifunctional conjugation protein TraI [Citrobacter amalonaticus]|nr:Multifunctional conjugation protein TraI [Citrobacter amalonaticus]
MSVRGGAAADSPLHLGDGRNPSCATVEAGKNTQQPLLDNVPTAVLSGLTGGQKQATTLVLGSTDQFIGIQGYAGGGKQHS